MKTRAAVTSNTSVVISHDPSDPTSWYVFEYRKSGLFRKQLSAFRFIDKGEAHAYAERIKRQAR